MTSSNPQHEPTMEEILASIRKIIAEDTNEAPHRGETEVLELTQEVHEEPVSAPVPPPSLAPTEDFTSASPAATPQAPATESPATETEPSTPANEDTQVSSTAPLSHDAIFSDRARRAIDDTFAGLDQVSQPQETQVSRAPSFPPVEGNSVEAVFERAVRSSVDPVLGQWMNTHREELLNAIKPLIREWMDEHFPALLEGAVRDEVARVIKARGGR